MECMNHLLWLRVGRGACIASGSTYNAISITPSYEEGGEQSGRRPLFSYERLGELSSSPTTENGDDNGDDDLGIL